MTSSRFGAGTASSVALSSRSSRRSSPRRRARVAVVGGSVGVGVAERRGERGERGGDPRRVHPDVGVRGAVLVLVLGVFLLALGLVLVGAALGEGSSSPA